MGAPAGPPGRAMTSRSGSVDLGAYCRQVEAHLMRANGGHLVRVAGPAFALVRGWVQAGVPLSVVCYGIDRKAERHRAGASHRPLRLEFCEADVRAAFDDWRRAVGVSAVTDAGAAEIAHTPAATRRPSLGRGIERALDRLSRAAGRLDSPESLRESVAGAMDELAGLREEARRARGDARERVRSRLAALDAELAAAARAAASDGLAAAQAAAEADLAAFRGRLAPDAWQRAVAVGVDRLLRERFGLPTLDPDAM